MRDVAFVLGPGVRLGILGANGTGKSTLLRMLAGREAPDSGEIVRGPRVRIAVFDQERTGLDSDATVFDAAGGGNTHVKLGEEDVHVASFLGRFLFTREMFDQRVSALSGGERARLLLARLLLRGANVLLLDEPTNDLDLLTLRVLEEAILAFDGAAVIVTHDRAFLDRTCTGVLAFEAEGRVTRYASRSQAMSAAKRSTPATPPAVLAPVEIRAKPAKRGLSFKEQAEAAAIPERIEALEREQAALAGVLAAPETYRQRAEEVPALAARLEALPAEIEALYARWEELEMKS
jgi:ATP-binding cassette subfamily F protein uup